MNQVFAVPGLTGFVAQAVAAFEASEAERLSVALTNAPSMAGVYALYYKGSCEYPQYQEDSKRNAASWRQPIYIGRASSLYDRIKNHYDRIKDVEDGGGNLALDEFACRFLAFEAGPEQDLIYPTEGELIRKYEPLWDGLGFGPKVVGGKRIGQMMSAWDVLHHGRRGRAQGGDPAVLLPLVLAKLDKKRPLYPPP